MDGDETEMRSFGDEGRLHGGNLPPYVEKYRKHLGRVSIDGGSVVHALVMFNSFVLLVASSYGPPGDEEASGSKTCIVARSMEVEGKSRIDWEL